VPHDQQSIAFFGTVASPGNHVVATDAGHHDGRMQACLLKEALHLKPDLIDTLCILGQGFLSDEGAE
jgi:hypothetical protein